MSRAGDGPPTVKGGPDDIEIVQSGGHTEREVRISCVGIKTDAACVHWAGVWDNHLISSHLLRHGSQL